MSKDIVQEKLNLPFFYGKEFENFIFFKLPKCLFTNKKFKGLSSDCKILYSLMVDRVVLSEKSNWRDSDGKIYIIYTNEEASNILGKSNKTITTIMTKMEEVGLIERKKQGLGKPDLIFVKNLLHLNEEKEENTAKVQCSETVKKVRMVAEKMESFEVNEDKKLYTFEELEYVDNLDCEKKLPVQSGNNDSSRVVKVTSLDLKELPRIKTDKTNTENNKTDLLRPIFPPNPTEKIQSYPHEEETEQREEGWKALNQTEKYFMIRSELDSAFGDGEDGLYFLFSSYRKNKSKMKMLVDMLLGMKDREETASQFEDFSQVKFNLKIAKLYSNALVEMLTAKNMITTNKQSISYSTLFEKMISHIYFDESVGEVRFDSIAQCTVLAYGEANKETTIKFPAAYMTSCILTVLNEGAIRDEAYFQYRYG